nr:jacalin-related lectin 3 isoform X1 [Ipomoea batatas]GMD21536.1 jacalin-related lectin 3 isoform X1 [Ipomoea batatas]
MPEGRGAKWDDHSLGQVEGIIVCQGSSSVHSLGFFCVKDNINQRSEQHGQCVGKYEMIILDYPTELLIGVHGFYYCSRYNAVVIRCITFVSNKATYGPFGGQRSNVDNAFSFQLSGKKEASWITGFYGTVVNNDCLGSLGVYIQKSIAKESGKSVDLVRGGLGNPWDDHSLGQVVGIVVSYNSTSIHTLRFLCVKDNIHQISEQHGCSGGNSEMVRIALDYPTEFLTAVRGYRDGSANLYSSSSSITIKSITFVTNKATYGPFGQQLKR